MQQLHLRQDFSQDDQLFIGWDDPDLRLAVRATDTRGTIHRRDAVCLNIQQYAQVIHSAARFFAQFPGFHAHIIGENDRVRAIEQPGERAQVRF